MTRTPADAFEALAAPAQAVRAADAASAPTRLVSLLLPIERARVLEDGVKLLIDCDPHDPSIDLHHVLADLRGAIGQFGDPYDTAPASVPEIVGDMHVPTEYELTRLIERVFPGRGRAIRRKRTAWLHPWLRHADARTIGHLNPRQRLEMERQLLVLADAFHRPPPADVESGDPELRNEARQVSPAVAAPGEPAPDSATPNEATA